MKIKTKRIITSLALAASLVLAPMNVSAATKTITQNDVGEGGKVDGVQTDVRYKGSAVKPALKSASVAEYTVTVPAAVDLTADEKSVDMDIVVESLSNLGDRNLQVKADLFNVSESAAQQGLDSGDLTLGEAVQFSEVGAKKIAVKLQDEGADKLGEEFNDSIGTISYSIELVNPQQ